MLPLSVLIDHISQKISLEWQRILSFRIVSLKSFTGCILGSLQLRRISLRMTFVFPSRLSILP